jgi:anaerobic selenocysteine-containing dehydrogenase
VALTFERTLTHFHAFYDEGRALPSLAKHNAAPQLWISRRDAAARQLSNGDAIKIYNEQGEFGANAHITDDVPPGVVWIRDGWVGLARTSQDRSAPQRFRQSYLKYNLTWR